MSAQVSLFTFTRTLLQEAISYMMTLKGTYLEDEVCPILGASGEFDYNLEMGHRIPLLKGGRPSGID